MNHSLDEAFSGADTGAVHGVARLARWSLAHRWIVVAGWVVLAITGGLLLNLISLAAAFGVLTFIWQHGHGTTALFASPATGAITLWVPLAVFALLFGLSMDYEVFILTRINEEYEQAGDVRAAVIRGIGHTGRLVTSGALILCLAFIALGGVPVTDVKILATGLAAGIIIDATVIRGVLAPALVALLGRANWWLPRPAARLLRVTPLTVRTTHGSSAPPGGARPASRRRPPCQAGPSNQQGHTGRDVGLLP